MRASLLVLAVVPASLQLVHMALARRVQRASFIPRARERRLAMFGPSQLSLPERGRRDRGAAGSGKARRIDEARPSDARESQHVGWRYYGFSNHRSKADATVTEVVVASSPAIGSTVSTLPDDCVSTLVNECVYLRCGNVWYQPQYTGSDVEYVVVSAP